MPRTEKPKSFGVRMMRVPISKIRPAAWNPREDLQPNDLRYMALARSIDRFGFVEPLVWNRRTGNLVGGHQRLKILAARGEKSADVSVVDLSPTEEKALNAALNKIEGEWDLPKLGDILKELKALPDFDETLTGFDAGEIDKLLRDLTPHEETFNVAEAMAAAPELAEKVKPGQLWQLGRHRLLCGDATNEKDVTRLFSGSEAQVTLTDPPYGVDYEHSPERRGIKPPAWQRGVNAYKDSTDMAKLLSFIGTLPSDILVMTFPVDLHFRILAQATEGFELLYECVWVKNHFAFLPGRRYQHRHEPILVFRRIKHKSVGVWNVPSEQSTVFEFDKIPVHEEHPTAKPLELFERLVEYHSAPNGIVYDPFLGSGTTMIACEKLGRLCYALEIAPIFCAVSIARYESYTGESAVLVDGKAEAATKSRSRAKA